MCVGDIQRRDEPKLKIPFVATRVRVQIPVPAPNKFRNLDHFDPAASTRTGIYGSWRKPALDKVSGTSTRIDGHRGPLGAPEPRRRRPQPLLALAADRGHVNPPLSARPVRRSRCRFAVRARSPRGQPAAVNGGGRWHRSRPRLAAHRLPPGTREIGLATGSRSVARRRSPLQSQ